MLVALLGRVWPQSLFMVEQARWTLSTLREFMDKIDDYVNAKGTASLDRAAERRDERRGQGLSKVQWMNSIKED